MTEMSVQFPGSDSCMLTQQHSLRLHQTWTKNSSRIQMHLELTYILFMLFLKTTSLRLLGEEHLRNKLSAGAQGQTISGCGWLFSTQWRASMSLVTRASSRGSFQTVAVVGTSRAVLHLGQTPHQVPQPSRNARTAGSSAPKPTQLTLCSKQHETQGASEKLLKWAGTLPCGVEKKNNNKTKIQKHKQLLEFGVNYK